MPLNPDGLMKKLWLLILGRSDQQKYLALARARGLSEIGNAVRQAILALAILSIRNKQEDLFLSETLESCGYFAMSFVAPFFIDRMRKTRALIYSDILSLLNSALLIAGVLSNSLFLLFLGSFLMTFLSSLYSSSLYAVTAKYAGGEMRDLRIGLSYLQRNVLIGALIGLLATSVALPHLPLVSFLIFDAVTFLLSSVWIYWVAKDDLASEVARRPKFASYRAFIGGLMREWQEGLVGTLAMPSLQKILLGNVLTCFGYGVLESSVVSTQKLVLGFSHSLVTATRAVNRVTAIGGSVFVGKFSKKKRDWSTRRFLFLGSVISAIGTAMMTIASTPLFVTSNAFYNFGWSFLNPTIGAHVAQQIPESLLGRVQAFRSLLINLSILLGNVAVMFLVRWIPVQYLFGVTSLCFVMATLLWRNHQTALFARGPK